MYLEFFESKGHLKMNSFSLVPHNDNSLLLINAGMAPLKPYFTGQEIPPRRRVTTCQKCIRTGDIENIGKTARHGTFFEMLGNFSFGDYFKHEAIAWSWEFLTQVVGLDPDRLYPSVYENDDEAFAIWQNEIGIAPERIFRFGKEDNFWEHGSGPCGPCSEIYYDRGEKYGCGKPGCTVGCDCDRYMEVWNNVFSQFDNDGHGNYSELKQKNIDTGMGLERLAVVVQDVDSIFDVDTIRALRDRVCELAGKEYHKEHAWDVSIRIITDHIRSATFMISDGILPSNEGRGYVLRRIMRRAMRHVHLLGVREPMMYKLLPSLQREMGEAYPELYRAEALITETLKTEESKFIRTLEKGLRLLDDETANLKAGDTLPGKTAFKLYDTYGFPLDLTQDALKAENIGVDTEGFDRAMEQQRAEARKNWAGSGDEGIEKIWFEMFDKLGKSEFLGYTCTKADGQITALVQNGQPVESVNDGEFYLIANQTPFYGESGGQKGDTGTMTDEENVANVTDTIKPNPALYVHAVEVTKGSLRIDREVTLAVDRERRMAMARNHSATHLLQAALRKVLGSHVKQAGSLVDPDHLRFDFSHIQAMTPDEIAAVEREVNAAILADMPVTTEVMDHDEAMKTGAMALFSEKYGAKVRVVTMGGDDGVFSRELCGGTHLSRTGQAGSFYITSESGVAAGVRRIRSPFWSCCARSAARRPVKCASLPARREAP